MRFTMSPKVGFSFSAMVVPLAAVMAACSSTPSTNTNTGGGGSSSGSGEGSGSGATGSSSGAAGSSSGVAGSSSGVGGSSSGFVTGSSSSGAGSSSGFGGSSSSSSSGGSSSGGGSSGSSSSSGGTGKDAGSGSGVVGGGSGDAGAGGPSLCAQAMMPPISATLCDGFEGATSDFTPTAAAPDTIAVATTKFYRGAKSMYFSATNSAYAVETKTFTGTTKATNNAFWGRYFFFNNMTTAPMSHSVFGDMSGTNATATAMDFHFVGGSRGKLQSQIQFAADQYTDNMKAPSANDPPFPLAADGWQCWEWQIQPDDSFDFYINGAEVMEMKIVAGKAMMSGANFAPLPVVTSLKLGWQYFGGSMNSGWIDEIAVGPNRIGCGN